MELFLQDNPFLEKLTVSKWQPEVEDRQELIHKGQLRMLA